MKKSGKYRITQNGAIMPLTEEKFDELWEEQKNNYTNDKYDKLVINVYGDDVLMRKGTKYFYLNKDELESILELIRLVNL